MSSVDLDTLVTVGKIGLIVVKEILEIVGALG